MGENDKLLAAVVLVVFGTFAFMFFGEPILDCSEDCPYYCDSDYYKNEFNLIPDLSQHRANSRCLCNSSFAVYELKGLDCEFIELRRDK